MPPDEKDIQKYVLNTQRGSTQGVARRDALHRHRCSEAVSPTNMGHISLCSDAGASFSVRVSRSPVAVHVSRSCFFHLDNMSVRDVCFVLPHHKLFAVYKLIMHSKVCDSVVNIIFRAVPRALVFASTHTHSPHRSIQLNPGYQLPTSLPGCHHKPSDAPKAA